MTLAKWSHLLSVVYLWGAAMPYIKNDLRKLLDVWAESPQSVGSLNYVITKVVHDYVLEHGLNYAVCNEVIGALACAKAEFYRTVVAPYEDKKRLENGPVSELDALPKRKAKWKAK